MKEGGLGGVPTLRPVRPFNDGLKGYGATSKITFTVSSRKHSSEFICYVCVQQFETVAATHGFGTKRELRYERPLDGARCE